MLHCGRAFKWGYTGIIAIKTYFETKANTCWVLPGDFPLKSTFNWLDSVPLWEETPYCELWMSISGTLLKALCGQAVGIQTYIEASLFDPDTVPIPPVAFLCLPKRVLPFIWLIWIPTWETSDALGELLHYTTRLLINHSNCTLCLFGVDFWT